MRAGRWTPGHGVLNQGKHQMGRQLLVLLGIGGLLGLLWGCAPGMPNTRLERPDKLPDRYGIVALQVVSNTNSLAPFLDNWTSVFVVDLEDTSKRYELEAKGTGLLKSRVFIGALPPGHYGLLMLQSLDHASDATRWINARVPRSVGTFHVDEDHFTSLGTLAYQPFPSPGDATSVRGKVYVVTRIEDRQDLMEFVADAYPDFHARLRPDGLQGWDPDHGGDFRAELATRMRSFALARHTHRVGPEDIALTGILGQVFWRRGDGDWRRADTGYTNELGTLVAYDGGYLAAGERGLVLRAAQLEGPWERVGGPDTRSAVYWLSATTDGRLHALSRSDDKVTFYEVSPDLSDWNSLHTFSHRGNFLFQGWNEVYAVHDEHGRIVLIGGGERVIHDPATGATHVGGSTDFVALAQQPDGVVVGVPGRAWGSAGRPMVSLSAGREWDRLQPVIGQEVWSRVVHSPPIRLQDGRVLITAHQQGRDSSGRRYPLDGLHVRIGNESQGVTSWGEALEEGCEILLPAISSAELVFSLCEDGRLKRSRDLGRTWQVDRDPVLDLQDVPDGLRGEGVEA